MKKLYRDEIALAMELLTEGWQQQHIAKAFSVKRETLRKAIRRAKVHGAKERPAKSVTEARIRHTNARAAKILATQGSAGNLPTTNAGSKGRNAATGAAGVSGLGKAVGNQPLQAKTPCQS
jgi:transposase-like protein